MLLNQITLKVTDLKKSIAFYKTLGLHLIVNSGNPYARFECPGGATTLSLSESETVTPGETGLYFEVENVTRTIAHLRAKGLPITQTPTEKSWRWEECWLTDPDGHRLCIYHAGVDRRFPPWRVNG
ncbi:MAG: VOC family protein [Pseudomonadota bacterium]